MTAVFGKIQFNKDSIFAHFYRVFVGFSGCQVKNTLESRPLTYPSKKTLETHGENGGFKRN